jgi:hypothetical protein
MSDSDDDDDDRESVATVTCDTMRKRIKTFLATKEMTQTAFLRDIGCNANSLGRFLKLKGAHNGYQNGIYWGAQRFFKTREKQAKKAKATAKSAPRKPAVKRKASSDDDDDDDDDSSDDAGERKKRAKKAPAGKRADVAQLFASIADVSIDDDGPVFDDCDAVRKKALELIASTGASAAAFARAIGVSAAVWNKFVVKSGATAGAGSIAYPRAYWFLERKRVMDGAPKSKARLANEKEHASGFALVNQSGWTYMF